MRSLHWRHVVNLFEWNPGPSKRRSNRQLGSAERRTADDSENHLDAFGYGTPHSSDCDHKSGGLYADRRYRSA